jgi:hypothetical protein
VVALDGPPRSWKEVGADFMMMTRDPSPSGDLTLKATSFSGKVYESEDQYSSMPLLSPLITSFSTGSNAIAQT